MEDQSDAPAPSLRERLKAKKAEADGLLTVTLPVSGEVVSFPKFVNHDAVMAATKLAGKNRSKVGLIVVAQVCRFGGEKLTADEIGSLFHNRDTVKLINLVLAEEEGDEGGEGN